MADILLNRGRPGSLRALAVALAAASLLGCQSLLELDEGQGAGCIGAACCPTAVVTCENACETVTDTCGRSVNCGGCPRWGKRFGGPWDQVGMSLGGMSFSGGYAMMVSGAFLGDIDFGVSQAPHSAQQDPGVFFAAFSSFGDPIWSKGIDTGALHYGVVGNGGAVAGGFIGDLNLGDKTLTGESTMDAFVAVLGTDDGKPVFSERYGDPPGLEESERGYHGVTASARVKTRTFFAGIFDKKIAIGSDLLTAFVGSEPDRVDSFLAAFNAEGEPQWSKRFGGGSGEVRAEGLGMDSFGNALVVGQFRSAMDITGGILNVACPHLSTAGDSDLFVAKVDNSGLCLWAIGVGGAGMESDPKLAVDPSGSSIIAGQFEGEISVGGAAHRSEGPSDAVIIKLDPSGNFVWSRRIGGEAGERITAITVDAFKNVIALGHFVGSINLGGGPLTSAGERDLFILKLDPDGNYIWSRRIGGSGDEIGAGIVTDFERSLYFTGSFDGTIDNLDPYGPLVSAGGRDVFLARISP